MNFNDNISPFISNNKTATSLVSPSNSDVQISWSNLSVIIAEVDHLFFMLNI